MIQESGSIWIYERPFIQSFLLFRLRRGSEPYVRGGGGDTGGGAAPASSVARHSSPLAPASVKVTGREANCRTCCSTSRTLRTCAHAAAQEGERRRFDALAQARKPAAKRACHVAYAAANPIHLLATRSHHRPATSITAVREAITPSSTPALSRQGIASPRPAPKLLMRVV